MVSLEKIFRALNRAQVRYLVAGGVAVNLHQVLRATADLDLIVHLEKENVLKFVQVTRRLGYRPRVSVNAEDLLDERKREKWIIEKGMVVFSFFHKTNPLEMIDIFVREPHPFKKLYSRRKEVKAFGTKITVVGIKDLINLKKKASRDKDLQDIMSLRRLL